MRYSRFAAFIAFALSPAFRLITAFIRLCFADHRTHLDLDTASTDRRAEPAAPRFKAFLARAFTHDRYSGGRFDLARSTPA